MGASPKLGFLFGSAHDTDYSIWGSVRWIHSMGVTLFRETTKCWCLATVPLLVVSINRGTPKMQESLLSGLPKV